MADNDIDITLNINGSAAIKTVKDFGVSAKKSVEDVSSSFDKIGKSMSSFGDKVKNVGVAVAAYLSVKALGGFFDTIIGESVDAQNNLNQLSAALARTGNNTKAISDDLKDFSAQMMNISTVDDDVINGQLAMALNFTQSSEQAKKLVKSAMDLSAAMGIDLNTATEMVGKSLDGTAGRLNELIPELKGVTEESLKTGAAIDIIAAKFGGAAASKVATFSGAMEQLKNNIGNFYAAMGDAITKNPMVIAGINELSKGLSKITGSVEGSTQNVQDFVNKGLVLVLSGIQAILPALDTLAVFLKMVAFQFEFIYKMALNAYDAVKIMFFELKEFTGDTEAYKGIAEGMKSINDRADSLIVSFDKLGQKVIDDEDIIAIGEAIERVKVAATAKPVKLAVEVDSNAAKKIQQTLSKEKLTLYDENAFSDEFARLKFIVTSTLKDIGEAIGSKLSAAGEGINKLANVAVSSVIGNISGGESGARSAVVEVTGAVGSLVDKIAGTGNFFGDAIKGLLNALKDPNTIKDMIRSFIDAIPTIIDSFIEAIPVLIDGIVQALPVLLDGIIRLIPVLFKALANGLPDILVALADAIPDLIIAIVENIPLIIEKIADKLDVIVEKLVSKIPNIAAALIKAIINVVITIITKAIPNIIKGLLNGVANWFKSGPVFEGVTAIGNFFKNIPNALASGVSSIGTFFQTLPIKLWEAFVKLSKFFSVEVPMKLWEAIVALFEFFYIEVPMRLWEAIVALFEFFTIEVPTKLWEAIVALSEFFTVEVPLKLWEAIKSVWDFFKGIGTYLQEAIDSIWNFFKDIPGKIGEAITSIFNFFNDLPGKLWDEIKGAFGGKKGGKGLISGTGTFLDKFATGGVVPKGYPNDSYPALLESNEVVVPAQTAPNLFSLIDKLSNGETTANSNNETNNLLRQLIAIMSNQQTQIDVKLDRDTLARAILSLNKDNRRLA